MHSSLLGAPCLLRPNSKTQALEDIHGRIWISEWPQTWRSGMTKVITMRDRSKNRKPTQRGRYLSIEAIQAVQALKRAKISGGDSLHRVLESKVRRLIKADMVAVLRELQSQGEGLLALQVFEEVRKEHWYKPQLLVYADMIKVLASNDLLEKVELICSYLKKEHLEADTEGFNLLLKTLLEFGFTHSAMDCYRLMKLWDSEPDESTFRILINGLESKGEMDLSIALRQEGEMYFGRPLEFSEKTEEMASTGVAES
ncbi:pentatricopeptide repeat-containing protein At1g62350 isoform X2 [Elaeis guineensis]|uniref:Pentatricopeptide repeat-containing protein At1g62350 n=1 Tax=Elaeis guineensis var. tenera TaxID=51953 RepID=A0A6I9S242_ELAGV|nr:pentatricopeptide repeat-containing protein At1g62350 [Elaeis guineensis]